LRIKDKTSSLSSDNEGHQDVISALSNNSLKEKLKNGGWSVDIVGEGPYRSFLENKVKENGLSDLVKFYGWVDNSSSQMKELYGRAKVFVSASWFENMSIVLLEALASGCIVIASNVGGNPEVITNKNNLFEKGDIEGLSNSSAQVITA